MTDWSIENKTQLQRELAIEKARSKMLAERNRNYQSLLTNSPITIWEQDITDVKHHIDTLRHSGIYDFRQFFHENPDKVKELIRNLILADASSDSHALLDTSASDGIIARFDIPFSKRVYHLFKEGLISISEGKTSFQNEFTAPDRKGEQRTFIVNWHVVKTCENGRYSAFISLTETTRTKKMENRLRESEEKHRLLLKSIANPTLALDHALNILYYNEAFHKTCGSPRIQLEGRNLLELFPSFKKSKSLQAMLDVLKDGQQRTVQGDFFGRIWRARIYATPWGIISISDDITESEHNRRNLLESELKYSTLVKHATDGIVVVQDEKIVFANPKALEITELEDGEDIFFWEIIHPDDRALVIDRYQKRIQNIDTPSEYCIKAISKNKRNFYAEIKSVTIMWQEKPAVLAIVNDITNKIYIERALEENQERYRAVMQQSGDNIYLAEYKTYRIIESNKALQDLLGYSEQELLNMTVFDFIAHPKDDVQSQIDKIELHGSLFLQNRKYTRKDGSLIDVEVSASMITYNGKKALCVVSRDVSERRKLEKEREKLISDLQSALANVKKLSGLLPICSSCKKIRDDEGYWQEVERYLAEHSEAEFTHGICPECAKKFYPALYKKKKD